MKSKEKGDEVQKKEEKKKQAKSVDTVNKEAHQKDDKGAWNPVGKRAGSKKIFESDKNEVKSSNKFVVLEKEEEVQKVIAENMEHKKGKSSNTIVENAKHKIMEQQPHKTSEKTANNDKQKISEQAEQPDETVEKGAQQEEPS
ncbi:uncharacterized protein LOC132637580 [Lycium barbarum]|uniref:uncharacterized protein LOC132637580 n=1 Tax=Lycium barbarum TaxID=112863 RepID=UPI00293F7456|nr:uncharacterized protein LOC132637580 [Lycium barbarum]